MPMITNSLQQYIYDATEQYQLKQITDETLANMRHSIKTAIERYIHDSLQDAYVDFEINENSHIDLVLDPRYVGIFQLIDRFNEEWSDVAEHTEESNDSLSTKDEE